MKINSKKGISLIVLVITIIVMIILATAIILSLDSSGIIGKANQAKVANDIVAKKEVANMYLVEYDLLKAEGKATTTVKEYVEGKMKEDGIDMSDVYVSEDGTLFVGNSAVLIKAEAKVGDVVEYEYTPGTYDAKATVTGATADQSFDSNGNEKITDWRILRIDEGTIKLIGTTSEVVTAENGLCLYGALGYSNSSNVLNGICEALYSGKYGTARSINDEDFEKGMRKTNKQTTYKYGYVYDETTGEITGEKTISKQANVEPMTVGQIEKEVGVKIANEYRTTPDGSNLESLRVYKTLSSAWDLWKNNVQDSGDKNLIESWYLLYGVTNSGASNYWYDEKVVNISLNKVDNVINSYPVVYRLAYATYTAAVTKDASQKGGYAVSKGKGSMGSRYMCDPIYGDNEDMASVYYLVRPVVTLNEEVQIEYDQENSKWIIKN